MDCSSLHFAALARQISEATRAQGLVPPSFRSPPVDPSATRSIRARPGAPMVAVRFAGRSTSDVANDMIAGVLAALGADHTASEDLATGLRDTLAAAGLLDTDTASAT